MVADLTESSDTLWITRWRVKKGFFVLKIFDAEVMIYIP